MRRNAKIAPAIADKLRAALGLLNAEIRENEGFADLVSCTGISSLTLEQWARNDETDPECRAIRANGEDTWPHIAERQCRCIQEWFETAGTVSGVRVEAPPRDPPQGYERLVDLLRSPSLSIGIDRPIRVEDRPGHLTLLRVHSEPPWGLEDDDRVARELDALRKAGRLPRDCRLLTGLEHRGSLKNLAEIRNRQERERAEKRKAEDRQKVLAQAEARVAELRARQKREEEIRAQARKLAHVFRQKPTEEKRP